MNICLKQQFLYTFHIAGIHCPFAGIQILIGLDGSLLRQQMCQHFRSDIPRMASDRKQDITRMIQVRGTALLESVQVSLPDSQQGFVIIREPQGPLPDFIHVRKDASRHPEQEMFHLVSAGQQTLPLRRQRIDDLALLSGLQVKDHVLCPLLFSQLCVPGIRPMVAMERFGDGGGYEEHPVQIKAAFTQRLAGDKALCNGLAVLMPFEVHIQIDAFAFTIICGTEDVRTFGDLPSILPVGVQ